MSPRAAWRLETLGFTDVYDFRPGKAAWAAAGLPMVGPATAKPRAGDVARSNVLTCGLNDSVRSVIEQMEQTGQDLCVVVNEDRVVFGRLRKAKLADSDGARVEAVMESGPSTIRPDEPLEDILSRMQKRNVPTIIVTQHDGVLIGLLLREDAERRLQHP